MKVAAFNVNSIKSRLMLLIDWLKREPVDVLCLQELKTTEDRFPYSELEGLGYTCKVLGQKTYNGVAVCSKVKPIEIIKDFGHEILDNQKRLIAIKINDFEIYSVYAPHGDLRGLEKYHYKLKWYDSFIDFIKWRHSPLILAGDFNVAHEDIDVYNPEVLRDTIGTMDEEREQIKRLLDLGLIDTFRYLHPGAKKFSWWDYSGGAVWKDEGMRIDYIFCSKSLIGNLKSAAIDTWPRRRRTPTPSDHAPVIAEFVI